MVRLKQSTKMSVLQGVTISGEGRAEAEVWIAVLKHAIALNSDDPFYDGLFYKDEVVVEDFPGPKLRLELRSVRVVKKFTVKFISEQVKTEFLSLITIRYDDGLQVPLPSSASTATLSPPSSASSGSFTS